MNSKDQSSRYLLPVVAQGVEPIVIASASGRTVTDVDGKNYLDCFSGISVVNAGHNHPRILAAAREQMEQARPLLLLRLSRAGRRRSSPRSWRGSCTPRRA